MTDRVQSRSTPVTGYHDEQALECRSEPRAGTGGSTQLSPAADQLVQNHTRSKAQPLPQPPAPVAARQSDCSTEALQAFTACGGVVLTVLGSGGTLAVAAAFLGGVTCGAKVADAHDACSEP